MVPIPEEWKPFYEMQWRETSQRSATSLPRRSWAFHAPEIALYSGIHDYFRNDLSEHPLNIPQQGGWLQKSVIDAVQNSPKYNKKIIIISYDESGGFGDHVVSDFLGFCSPTH